MDIARHTARQALPIGVQSFRTLREEGYYYVDKTGLILDLLDSKIKYLFLSRPRRFGKSLLLDTLKELFEGNRALFTGLAAETRWDWDKKYPVISISFGRGQHKTPEQLARRILTLLHANAERLGVDCPLDEADLAESFAQLIEHTVARYGVPAVVLIDEYDKPILDVIEQRAVATDMREVLRDLYSVVKDCSAHLRFALITGVSKFSKAGLFSGLNNLSDITLDARYSALCGYTDADVDTVFAPELPGLDREQMRHWYNGYNWTGTSVYNPFDLLQLFDKREFFPYWFETGTPSFLIKVLAERAPHLPNLERLVSAASLLSTFDVDQMPPEALMFQTGYLTLHGQEFGPAGIEYTLGYPNHEVRTSFNQLLLPVMGVGVEEPAPPGKRLRQLLEANDFAGLRSLLHALFASIPHDWHRNNKLARSEGFYASVLYVYFSALGLDTRREEPTHLGQLDMALLYGKRVYIFEFKMVDDQADGSALAQIKAKDYAAPYRSRGEPIFLIGIEFSRAARNVVGFDWEALP